VILDRDGTIVIDRHYLDDPDQLQFLPGAAEGLRLLCERGNRVVVVTNQSGVARGRLSLERLHEINARFLHLVRLAGARIEGIYYCPHQPEDNCECRKPKTKLVLDAASELGFEPSSAVVIGDQSGDIELGRRVGAITMLISENGLASDGKPIKADFVVRDLLEAARVIASPGLDTRSRDRDKRPL
jgi:D-glycero-D-manno-heptose 1,7-bisphosphate phosphatase